MYLILDIQLMCLMCIFMDSLRQGWCVTSLKACVEKVQVGRIAFDWCGAQTGINRNGQAPEDLLE